MQEAQNTKVVQEAYAAFGRSDAADTASRWLTAGIPAACVTLAPCAVCNAAHFTLILCEKHTNLVRFFESVCT
jgi:broad specificity polyphosphatase/5'/3'-nucleotidase SurE